MDEFFLFFLFQGVFTFTGHAALWLVMGERWKSYYSDTIATLVGIVIWFLLLLALVGFCVLINLPRR